MSFFDTILSRSGRSNRPILPLWRLKITDTEYQELKDELAAEATKAYGEALFRGLQREAALFVAEYWRREYIDGAHREQDVYDALSLDPNRPDRFAKCEKFIKEAKSGALKLGVEIYTGIRSREFFDSMLYQGGLPMQAITRIEAGSRWPDFTRRLVQDKIDYEELRERLGKISTEIGSIKEFCSVLTDALARDRIELMPFDCTGQTGIGWFSFLKELAIREKKRQRLLRPLSLDWEFTIDEREGEIKVVHYVVSGPHRLSEEFLEQQKLSGKPFFSVQVRINGKPGEVFDFQNGFCRETVFTKHPYHDGDIISVYLHDHETPILSDSVDLSIPHILYRDGGVFRLGNRLGKARSLIIIPQDWTLDEDSLPLTPLIWGGLSFQGLFLENYFEGNITLRDSEGTPLTFGQDSLLYWSEIASSPMYLPDIIETIYNTSSMQFKLCSDSRTETPSLRSGAVEFRGKGESSWSALPSYGVLEARVKGHNGEFVSPVRFINAGGISIEPLSVDKDRCVLKFSWEHGSVYCREGKLKSKGDLWEILRSDCPDSRIIHFTLVPKGHSQAQFDISVRAPFKDFSILDNDGIPVENLCQVPYSDIDKYQYHLAGQGVQSYTYGDRSREIKWEGGKLFLYENGHELRSIPYEGSLVSLFDSREVLRSLLDKTSRGILDAEVRVCFNIDRSQRMVLTIKDYPYRFNQREDGAISIIDSRGKGVCYRHSLNIFNLEDPEDQVYSFRADKDGLFILPEQVNSLNKVLLAGRTRGRILPALVDINHSMTLEERENYRQESILRIQKEIGESEIGSSVWKRIISWYHVSQREGIPASSLLDLYCLAHGNGDALLSFAFQLFLDCSDEDEASELSEQLIQFGNDLSFQWYWLKPKSDSILPVLSFILEGNTPILRKMANLWGRGTNLEFSELFPIVYNEALLNEYKPQYCDWVIGRFRDWLKRLFRASVLDSYLVVDDADLSYIANALAGDLDEHGKPVEFVSIRSLDNLMVDINQENADRKVKDFFEEFFPHPGKPINEQWMLGRAAAMAAHLRGKINLFSVPDSIRRSILFCRKSCPKAFLIALNNKMA